MSKEVPVLTRGRGIGQAADHRQAACPGCAVSTQEERTRLQCSTNSAQKGKKKVRLTPICCLMVLISTDKLSPFFSSESSEEALENCIPFTFCAACCPSSTHFGS